MTSQDTGGGIFAGWGNRLTAARTAANLSRRQLAEQVGVTAKTIQRWEGAAGAYSSQPSARQQQQLADALGIPVSDLLPRSEREGTLEGLAAEYDDLLQRVGNGCS
jgi:transcriptional regulator with XRE-family HTH domain